MTRHRLAEILLMVLAVCGALAILSLVGLWFVHASASATPPGTSGGGFTLRRVSSISLTRLMVAVVVIALPLVLSLRRRR